MNPNLVLQQLISDKNSTLPNMPISTFEASMVNCQWSMVNTFLNTFNGSVQPISYPHNLQPCSTSGLEQLPTQLNAQWNRLPPFQPFLRSSLCISIIRIPIVGGHVVGPNGGGLVLESVQSRKKESGLSNWAAGGRKSQHSPNAWGWWWRMVKVFCAWDTILLFSLVRIAFR